MENTKFKPYHFGSIKNKEEILVFVGSKAWQTAEKYSIAYKTNDNQIIESLIDDPLIVLDGKRFEPLIVLNDLLDDLLAWSSKLRIVSNATKTVHIEIHGDVNNSNVFLFAAFLKTKAHSDVNFYLDGNLIDSDVLSSYTDILRDKCNLPHENIDFSTLSQNKQAAYIISQIGRLAVNDNNKKLYIFDGSVWIELSEREFKQEIIKILKKENVDFTDRLLNSLSSLIYTMADVLPPINKEVIAFANGTYEVENKKFREHLPEDGLLSHNQIEYIPMIETCSLESLAPSFFRWLAFVSNESISSMDVILSVLYMVLANRYEWQLFIEVTGEGGTGKSVFSQILSLLAGGLHNVASTNMMALDNARGRANVVGKRLILLPDQPKYTGDGAGIKAITGGDLVEIDGKYEKQYSIVLHAVVVITNNQPMIFTEKNGGIARRRVIFSFDRVVPEAERDILLIDKIKVELPFLIHYLFNRFSDPSIARSLLIEQRNSHSALSVKRASDPIIDFCGYISFMDQPHGLFLGGNANIQRNPRKFVYHLYLSYLAFNGLNRPLSNRDFAQELRLAAKEYGQNYLSRTINGRAQTNITILDFSLLDFI